MDKQLPIDYTKKYYDEYDEYDEYAHYYDEEDDKEDEFVFSKIDSEYSNYDITYKNSIESKYAEKYDEIFSYYYEEKYNELQYKYDEIKKKENDSNLNWFITVQKTNLNLCLEKVGDLKTVETYHEMGPKGVLFSPDLLDGANWIQWVLNKRFEFENYHPNKNFITAIAIDKKNIYTYKEHKIINSNNVEDFNTNSKKKIFLVDSHESAKYLCDNFEKKDESLIDWKKFCEIWQGGIFFNKSDVYGDSLREKYSEWYKNWKSEELILFDREPIEKCFEISKPTISDDFYKKKYLKYKLKYLNLKQDIK